MNSGDKAHEMDEDDIFDARAAHERNRKKRYLITGITGFAGAHLAELLHKEGHEVIGLIRKSNGMESDILDVVSQECFDAIKFEYGDITDRRSLEKVMRKYPYMTGSFLLAAQSHPPTSFLHPLDTFNINVMGTANLIDVIEHIYGTDCKIMQCSTSEVYGNSGSDGKHLKESDPLAPCNPYAVSKAASDLYMQERMMNKKINGFVTRAFSHSGARRGRTFSISCDAYQIASKMLEKPNEGGIPYQIDVGNLETVRTVIDVRDIVRAYYLLMMNPESSGKVFNVCGDTPRKMGFFTDFMIAESGLNIEKVISPKLYRPIDIAYQIGDTTAIRELTGWKPEIPIEQTLCDLLQYWIRKMQK